MNSARRAGRANTITDAPLESGNWKTLIARFATGWLARQESVVVVLVLIFACQIGALFVVYQNMRHDLSEARSEFLRALGAQRATHEKRLETEWVRNRQTETERHKAHLELLGEMSRLTREIARLSGN
jgi:hypothetical protein